MVVPYAPYLTIHKRNLKKTITVSLLESVISPIPR